jgi:serine/threonine-protein kinase
MAEPSPDPLFFAFQQAVIGRYSLERELGRGGMGVVYLAREVRLDRPVAIKLLPPEYAARPELRDRFMREARTAARLSHPYIVPIHAVEEIDGFVFIVMAFVDGGTLAQRVASHGPLPAPEVTRIMQEVAWALAYAHVQGIVHRDIKPANILLERGTGRAMVADFGIARLAESSGDTAVGVVLGTPEFMSPEQASAEPIDGRSDLYALGVVAYFALTAKLPFTAPTVQGVLAKQLSQAPPAVATETRGVPRALAQAIDRCLRKEPAARFESGGALADALDAGIDKRADVPVPVRVFLDRRRMFALVLPAALSLPIITGSMSNSVRHTGRFSPWFIVLDLVISLGAPLGIILYRLRNLMRLGYGSNDIVSGLRTRFQRQREEFHFEFGLAPSARERMLRVAGAAGIVVGAASLITLITGPQAAIHALKPAAPIAFVVAYLGVVATAVGTRWRHLREGTGTIWSKFWGGRAGRALAKLASVRLAERGAPADRPTELAIAMNAEALFAGFPKELRQSLGDVPEVLHGLEAHARVARARVEELNASIADAQRGAPRAGAEQKKETLLADLARARDLAETRLADLVTALENLRLDLLRLRAGAGSVEGITVDLAAAREVGDDADRLLAGGREVERALRSPPTPV